MDDAILRQVIRNTEVSPGARLLYLELQQWITEDLNICFPTQEQLVENLGAHRNTLTRWFKELDEAGLVKSLGRSACNSYEVTALTTP